MRTIVQLSLLLILVLGFTSCSTKPQPIVFGEDHCHFCKMTIMDEKFGAELVTQKGKVYKFDDIKCLLDYYHSGDESHEAYQHKLVVDFGGQGALLDATNALYLKSTEIRSPMNGQVAAFGSKPLMEVANKKWNGEYLSWDELSTPSR
jgi:copper chaperone NosL